MTDRSSGCCISFADLGKRVQLCDFMFGTGWKYPELKMEHGKDFPTAVRRKPNKRSAMGQSGWKTDDYLCQKARTHQPQPVEFT